MVCIHLKNLTFNILIFYITSIIFYIIIQTKKFRGVNLVPVPSYWQNQKPELGYPGY